MGAGTDRDDRLDRKAGDEEPVEQTEQGRDGEEGFLFLPARALTIKTSGAADLTSDRALVDLIESKAKSGKIGAA